MTRTFVALLIPPDWQEYLGTAVRDLARGTTGLSWVKPENVHVTLRFLGDLGDSGVRRVSDAVTAGAGNVEAPRARLGAVGAFPSLVRPRVIWIGLAEGAEAVLAVGRGVNDALRRAGFGPPDKPLRPHLTLARVREGARGLERLREARLSPAPDAALLDHVCVMKSELHPAGARYTALTEVRLRPPGGTAPTPPRTGTSPES